MKYLKRPRPPYEQWQAIRRRIWQQNQGRCQGPHCADKPPYSLPLRSAHIDHIVEVSVGGNHKDTNLRTLCRRCHCLRASIAHQGMIAGALRDGVIPANWRSLVWED
jgi:5-methylcytosine-specific restriction endonuclease McrA